MATGSAEPGRGQVWLVRLGANEPGEPGKSRPAVIVSIDELRTGSERDLYVVVPISATEPWSQMRPRIDPGDAGVERPSVAVPRTVRSVARTRLLRRLGSISPETLRAVEQALAVSLNLE